MYKKIDFLRLQPRPAALASMCITALALEAHPCFPFILVHTRDEDWDRATEPVQTHDDGNGNGALVFARDVQAGGTFLGLNLRTFGFGAITNIRSNVPRPDHAPSRGELVIRAIRGEALEGSAHTAYSLHHGTVVPPTAQLDRSLPSDDGWKHTSVKVVKGQVYAHANEPHAHEPNSDPTEPSWPKTRRLRDQISVMLRRLFADTSPEEMRDRLGKILEESWTPPENELPDLSQLLLPEWKERELQSGPLIDRGRLAASAEKRGERWEYGTVCHSVVVSCAQTRNVYFWSRSLHNSQQTPGEWTSWQVPWPEDYLPVGARRRA